MSLRTSLLKVAGVIRTLPAGPGLALRTSTVTVVTTTWPGGRAGADGGSSESTLLVSPNPLVRELTAREIAASGGRFKQNDLKVGPITPTHSGGGYSLTQIAPRASANGVEIFYRLTGPYAGEYTREEVSTGPNELGYYLTLRRRRTTP